MLAQRKKTPTAYGYFAVLKIVENLLIPVLYHAFLHAPSEPYVSLIYRREFAHSPLSFLHFRFL